MKIAEERCQGLAKELFHLSLMVRAKINLHFPIFYRRVDMYTKPLICFCLLSSMVLIKAADAQDNRTRKFFAVQEMVSSVQKKEEIQFTVMLRRYFIEGVSYRVSMMTVSPMHTFDIVQTGEGFKAFVLFPKERVHADARKNEIRDGIVKVRLKVLLDDIYLIVGHNKSGEQINLYQ